jgi:hypothetical protein
MIKSRKGSAGSCAHRSSTNPGWPLQRGTVCRGSVVASPAATYRTKSRGIGFVKDPTKEKSPDLGAAGLLVVRPVALLSPAVGNRVPTGMQEVPVTGKTAASFHRSGE